MQKRWTKNVRKAFLSLLVGVLLLCVGLGASWGGGMTTGVFSGFTRHISQQIMKDKYEFALAQNCAIWHYKQLKKKPSGFGVQQTSFTTITENSDPNPCPPRYAQGIDGARAAFAHSQSLLSLSLTFYQFALVGDRNDDGEYDETELQDVFESVGVNFLAHDEAGQYLAKLNGKFDRVRQATEFSVLMDGMQALFHKGYRLTSADQEALNRVTGQSPS